MSFYQTNQWGYPPASYEQSDSLRAQQQRSQLYSQNGAPYSPRPFQPTVEDVADESRMYYGSDDLQRSPIMSPYTAHPNYSDTSFSSFNNSPFVPAYSPVSARRSHAAFSPPPLTTHDSSLSSTTSNFSIPTPPPIQQCRRRSSRQAFSEWEDRDALARANKRLATGRLHSLSKLEEEGPFQLSSEHWSGLVADHRYMQSEQNPPVQGDPLSTEWANALGLDWPEMQKSPPFPAAQYDPFSPPLFTAPFSNPNSPPTQNAQTSFGRRASQTSPRVTTFPPHATDNQRTPTATTVQDVRNAPAGTPFENHLRSEMNRRNIADKTIQSIRSASAKALAHSKENARRTDWAKEVLLKFPVECALAESLNPAVMMREVARHGVFESGPSAM